MSSLLIFDGNNTAFRSAAVLSLTNADGRSVSVPFGVIKSVRHVIEKFKPSDAVVVWDGGRSEFRKALLPGYKETEKRKKARKEASRKEIYEGIKIAQSLLGFLGIRQYKFKGWEADDVIAWMERHANYDEIIIVSSDKDFWQLISDRCSVYSPTREVLLTRDNFRKTSKTGLSVKKYLTFHILNGDKGDGVPGIEGIGEKTVLEIISRFKKMKRIKQAIKEDHADLNPRWKKHAPASVLKAISRNRKLVSLKYYIDHFSIPDASLNILDKLNIGSDYVGFEIMIKAPNLRFNSILKDTNYWLMPFRKQNIRSKQHEDRHPLGIQGTGKE